ncbi:MAG: molecular chaperone DnaJ [Coriobacteriia bacterium]|nr:molecular chaperone DnaJ [Coriobacteriia bacterium]
MANDLYEILGVNKNATDDEIKRAYRRKARELHPDVSELDDAEEKFKELNEAYDVLSDPNKRAQYDRFGTIPGAASGGNPFGGGAGYVDFEDLFGGGFGINDIFSSFFNGGAGATTSRTEGRDMTVGLRLTLEEVATGTSKEIVYDRLAPCDDCHGTGLGAGGEKIDCPTCHGQGKVVTVQQTFLGSMQTATTCPDCHGTGKSIKNPCSECNGQGRVPDRQRVSVEVPAGVKPGTQLRVEGYGEAGVMGDSSGDLIVTCKIQPHDFFERDGDNLLSRINVSYLQAILGATIEFDGIFENEKVKIKIPKGTQAGDVLKAKDMGMPRMNRNARGDLYAQVNIDIPKKLTKKEKELLRELSNIEEGNPKKMSPLQNLRDSIR